MLEAMEISVISLHFQWYINFERQCGILLQRLMEPYYSVAQSITVL